MPLPEAYIYILWPLTCNNPLPSMDNLEDFA